jgi:thioredoxin-like negative regulator of GroEL
MRIQSIPAVFAFVDGQPVDGFMGALPESDRNLSTDGRGALPNRSRPQSRRTLGIERRTTRQRPRFRPVLQADRERAGYRRTARCRCRRDPRNAGPRWRGAAGQGNDPEVISAKAASIRHLTVDLSKPPLKAAVKNPDDLRGSISP